MAQTSTVLYYTTKANQRGNALDHLLQKMVKLCVKLSAACVNNRVNVVFSAQRCDGGRAAHHMQCRLARRAWFR